MLETFFLTVNNWIAGGTAIAAATIRQIAVWAGSANPTTDVRSRLPITP